MCVSVLHSSSSRNVICFQNPQERAEFWYGMPILYVSCPSCLCLPVPFLPSIFMSHVFDHFPCVSSRSVNQNDLEIGTLSFFMPSELTKLKVHLMATKILLIENAQSGNPKS